MRCSIYVAQPYHPHVLRQAQDEVVCWARMGMWQGTYIYAATFMIIAQTSPPFVKGSSTRRYAR
jgi:hypothetical protein